MIEYLRTANDDLVKADIVKRVSDLAERFAPDTQWFIDTKNQVRTLPSCIFEHHASALQYLSSVPDNIERSTARGCSMLTLNDP